MYKFYGKKSRGNYKFIMKCDTDGKEIAYFIILEQHLIETGDDTPNFKICICTDGKTQEQIWFKCVYFDIDNYEILFCDNKTKTKYQDEFGKMFNRKIKNYVN